MASANLWEFTSSNHSLEYFKHSQHGQLVQAYRYVGVTYRLLHLLFMIYTYVVAIVNSSKQIHYNLMSTIFAENIKQFFLRL